MQAEPARPRPDPHGSTRAAILKNARGREPTGGWPGRSWETWCELRSYHSVAAPEDQMAPANLIFFCGNGLGAPIDANRAARAANQGASFLDRQSSFSKGL